MTESTNTRIHPGLSIRDLRSQFNGRVIVPGDDGYDQARTPIYSGVDRNPPPSSDPSMPSRWRRSSPWRVKPASNWPSAAAVTDWRSTV